jgi:hypothetical protein
MNTPLVPDCVDMAHPVVRKVYSLFTPPIEELVDTCGAWIDGRVKGGTIYGPSQFGKSSGVDHWLGQLLEERLKERVSLIIWTHQDHGSSTSPGGFHSKLLKAASDGAFARGNATKTLHRLIERFIELAYSNEGHFIVVVIDEAQGMSEKEWLWLVQLHSTLEAEGVQLCVISIASFQFNERPRDLAMTGSAHAAARFMLHDRQFRGLQNAEEIGFVLKGYDEDSEWPLGSGLSYSAGLAPRAFAEGFRISNYSHQLWDLLHECLPKGYSGKSEFPMQSIALAARYVLLRVAGSGSNWQNSVALQSWRDGVISSGHTKLMGLVSLYGGHARSKRGA